MVSWACCCILWLPCEKGKRRKGQFIRNNFREDAVKVDIQSHGLLIANLARLQAILIAGGAPQRPVGLLKSVGQHRELAAVAQRTGGTARPSAVKAVVLWKLPFLQEMGQGLVTAAVQVCCSHAGHNSTGLPQRLGRNERKLLPTNADEGTGQRHGITTAILPERVSLMDISKTASPATMACIL